MNSSSEPIAIIGMAGRFPDACNIDQFWENLASGRESIQTWPEQDLLALGIAQSTLDQPSYVKASAILEDIDLFDAEFFRLNPREAEITDPQHRLFLECAWEVMEQSGHAPGKTPLDVGVFVAASRGVYEDVLRANPNKVGRLGLYRLSLATEREFIPAWVSYKLGLCGPSVAVQTACSSGLMVVHAACQSLLRGECAMALAGAVSIYVRQKEGYFFQPGGIHSPDGRCRAFDKNARGTVRGNGLGAVLLKPLAAAQQDGDYIWAVIRGSASNNDGARRVGFTAPSPDGQADVIRRALAAAGVSADSISYVEAHGTGTELGDPTEVEGLKLAFGQSTERREFCAIGSVKTNIGHLNAAAGIAGLIKTVLSLHHGKLPASLNCETPNPLIPFRETPFYVNTIFREWPEGSSPRRAGVSSFGVGGTNVHVVLEAAARREIPARHEPCQLLSISADSEAALRDAALKLAEHLTSHKDLALADVAYTLHTGRNDRSHRQLLVCSTIGEAIEGLNSPSGSVIKGQAPRQTISVGLFFPGHAWECAGWGRCLYQSNAAFRDTLDECAARLRRHRSVNLLEYLYPEFRHQEITEPDLNSLPVAQCALFAVEYAMARTLLELGVSPNWMLGDNLGEYVAACLSGVFSLDDALFLVCYRAQLMQYAASFTGPILSKFASAVEAVPRRTPAIPFLSGLTGDWIETRDAMSTAYWVDHLCQSMRFSDALTKALKIPHTILLDCGPKPSLARVFQSMNSEPESKQIVAVASRTDEHPSSEVRALITAIGRLWLAGAQIDWAAFYKGQDGRVVPLPAYPFQRSRYWVDPESGSSVHANPGRSIA